MGLIVYNMLEQNTRATGTPKQLATLQAMKAPFVDAVNRMLPADTTRSLWPMIQKMLPLVDDDTIPNGLKDVEGMMQDMLADQAVLQAIADLGGSLPMPTASIDQRDALLLVGRLISHPEFDKLAKATNELIAQNPKLIPALLGVVSRQLKSVTAADLQAKAPQVQGLAQALLAQVDTTGLGDLGAPAWAVRLDKNGNPKVAKDPATGMILPPFVDDGSGTAAINAQGRPVDSTGAVIDLKPFGKDGNRDQDGRAVTAGGLTVYEYFDAKKTVLGEVLILVGLLMKKGVTDDLVTVLDKTVPRVTHTTDPNDPWVGFGPDNPLSDLTWAQLELVRRTPVPQLLEGLALVVKNDPAKFEDTVTEVILAGRLAAQSGFSAAGQQKMMDDLLPLLSEASRPNGQKISAVRALLRSFASAQAQYQTLPKGFATMMKFHDVGKKIPTGPGLPSAMERLLGIMDRSNQCNAPFLGNLAELYLDTMAGNNKAILGIKLDIKTMNSLIKIGFLRSLLCSKLVEDDVAVLQDFADSGALDSFIPIAKAFSDQGETKLLVQIMLGLGKHYATAMRPNEPAVVKLLESGAVEKLFKALNGMAQVRIPSNGQFLMDVLADTMGALFDDSRPIVDRRGRSHKTLTHLLMAPMKDLTVAATNAGVGPIAERAFGNLFGTVLATYVDATGKEKLVFGGLVATLGDTLAFVSKTIPADPAQRSQWVDAQQKQIDDLLQSRMVAFLVDMLLMIKQSPSAKVFHEAISGLFAPVSAANARHDALGAIVRLAANVIQKPASTSTAITAAQATALATVLNWLGAEIDPAAHKMDRLLNMVLKMVAADDGLLFLRLIRNGIDMGPSGNEDPPLFVILGVLQRVKAAGNTSSGMTVQDLEAQMKKMLAFMQDKQNGLPHIFELIKARSK